MKKITILILFLVVSNLFAQNYSVFGKVTDPNTNDGMGKVLVVLMPSGIDLYTDDKGNFIFENLPAGTYTIKVYVNNYEPFEKEVTISNQDVILEDFVLKSQLSKEVSNNDALVATVNLTDDDSQSESTGDNNVAGVLSASRDVFVSNANFIFSTARWRSRGYNNGEFQVFINNVPMNELDNGRVLWGNWGGLNDMFRFNDQSYGLEPTTFAFGEIGGANNIDAAAARQRKQLRVSYSGSNRQYNHRIMATYSTGVMKGGWAISASASYRVAPRSYFPGTFMDTWAYFFSLSKKFGQNHVLSFTTFGVPGRRGKSSPSIREVMDLTGDRFYNSNWGYQNGQVRNANVNESYQPMYILSHEWTINKNSSLHTGLSFQWGKDKNSYLNWNDGQNPDPDFYRYLPSYYTDSVTQQEVADKLRANPNMLQINWDNIYNANYSNQDSVLNANGEIGNTVRGNRSVYVLENRVEDLREVALNTIYNLQVSNRFAFTAGGMYQMQYTRNYKEIKDLLGGDYFVDYNQFAQFTFPGNIDVSQSNAEIPNRVVRVGDEYGYNYEFHQHKGNVWAQGKVTLKKVDFFISAKVDITSYWRNGLWQTGLFPNNSKGESSSYIFISPFVKGGATYKINGRNYVFANGAFGYRAPFINDVFLSPRTRNQGLLNPNQQLVYSAEAGYIHNGPKLKIRATGYYTMTENGTRTISFYHDEYNNNVNVTLEGINVRSFGGEFGLEYKFPKGFSANAAVAIGRQQYVDRPQMTTTLDNSQQLLAEKELVYYNNVNLGNGPQWANTLGVAYNSPKFWFVRMNFNYFDWMWVEVNPTRRTARGVEGLDPASDQYKSIVAQERLPGAFTMDAMVGYSWKLNKTFPSIKKNMYLNLSANVNNITNTMFFNGGFEQLRYDFEGKNPNKFATKYFPAMGINFFITATFRM